ncbi:MAG: hypothetical protein ACOC78_01725 [Actinomycetota bacterium]
MAMEIKKPDISCYPFRRKKLYLAIVIPYAAVLAAVFFYLLARKEPPAGEAGAPGAEAGGGAGEESGRRYVPGLIFLAFYLGMCYFQAYCCACQECPYVGEFCPALAGIYPANQLARVKYGEKGVVKSEEAFQANATAAAFCWGGMMLFPLPWLARRSARLAAGYLLVHAVYYMLHGLVLCPVCVIRDTCPGGKMQSMVRGIR